jgi:uracil-DNA glycosylase
VTLFWRSKYLEWGYDVELLAIPDGPPSGDILFIGQSLGQEEEIQKTPFVGPSGRELKRMQRDAGIKSSDCLHTNLIMTHPPGNDFNYFCCGAKDPERIPSPSRQETPLGGTGSSLGLPAVSPGHYLKKEHAWNLERLAQEITTFSPNIIVPLGNEALWAVLRTTGITKYRGSVAQAPCGGRQTKILPTFHPAAILRAWENRVIVVADLIKAERESHYPEVRVLKREVWLDPTVEDLWRFYEAYIEGCEVLSFDIETAYARKRKDRSTGKVVGIKDEFIACVSLSPGPLCSLVVPFIDREREGFHYWKTLEEEFAAWQFLRFVFESKTVTYDRLAQNGLFDMQFLWTEARVPVWNYLRDTMIRHHAWQPQLPKDLGFLGSVYTNERSWKPLRPRGTKTTKREE